MSVSSVSESHIAALLSDDAPPPTVVTVKVKKAKRPTKAVIPAPLPTGGGDPAQPAPVVPAVEECPAAGGGGAAAGSHGVAETESVPESNITIPRTLYQKLIAKEAQLEALEVKYEALKKKLKATEDTKSVSSGKSENSPTDDGRYARWDVMGNRAVRAKYVDNKKDIAVDTPLLGVRCDQKNNSRTYMKKGDFRLVWVSGSIVRDTDTGVKYSHKGGVFHFIDEETDKSVSVKIMYDIVAV
jgi:hypothetical protein